MWMMGYNEGDFNTRKLRPLIPRPISSSTNNVPSPTLPSLTRTLHGTDFFSLNHHMEQSKRELNTQAGMVVSSRWNPTPEQLRTLEELYRRGTRTPSADQIQHITAQLRRYGKIEGKNVFYWFQNHKARERQKRRRQMDVSLPHEPESHERKELGSSRTSYEGGQTKNWSPPTNCSILAEESAPSKQKAAAESAAPVLPSAECSRPENGWIQFDPDPITISNVERNATWRMVLNPSAILSQEAAATKRTMMVDPNNNIKLVKARELMNIFIASSSGCSESVINGGSPLEESQTLQLFPVRSIINGGEGHQLLVRDKDSGSGSSEINTTIEGNRSNLSNSFQFYEFLPMKN